MDFIFLSIILILTFISWHLNISAKKMHYKNFLKIRNIIRKHQVKAIKNLYN